MWTRFPSTCLNLCFEILQVRFFEIPTCSLTCDEHNRSFRRISTCSFLLGSNDQVSVDDGCRPDPVTGVEETRPAFKSIHDVFDSEANLTGCNAKNAMISKTTACGHS